MFVDVVFAHGHEKEFIELAERLGYSNLVFAHLHLDEIWSMPSVKSDVEVAHAFFISSSKKSEVVNLIHRARREKIMTIVKAHSDVFNRFIVEKTDADSLADLEFFHKKDHLHFRRGGLDQVMCKAAAVSKKTFLTSFSQLAESHNRALILGRIAQNILFCKKYDLQYSIVSFAQHPFEMKGAHDMRALVETLGRRQ